MKTTGNARFDKFYQAYPNKKSKGDALKAWEKLEPDDDLTEKMILAIQAQSRYRREALNSKEFLPDWKLPATWLRAMCWEDEIESHSALKEKQAAEYCQCGREATHRTYHPVCTDCWYHENRDETRVKQFADLRREEGRKLGIAKGKVDRQYKETCLSIIWGINPVMAAKLGRNL